MHCCFGLDLVVTKHLLYYHCNYPIFLCSHTHASLLKSVFHFLTFLVFQDYLYWIKLVCCVYHIQPTSAIKRCGCYKCNMAFMNVWLNCIWIQFTTFNFLFCTWHIMRYLTELYDTVRLALKSIDTCLLIKYSIMSLMNK